MVCESGGGGGKERKDREWREARKEGGRAKGEWEGEGKEGWILIQTWDQ